MAKALPQPWTVKDFLAFEAEEAERYEYVDGIVRMMTGGSAAHSVINNNTTNLFNAALRAGPCRAYVDDLKVVAATAVMYPDVVAICRPLAPDDDRMSDPTVVVEVLSPTTERHDRIAKWRQYQTIATLQHFVLVAQSERRVEVHSPTAHSDEAGRGFRFEGGHHSDLKPARTTGSPRVVVDDRDRGGSGQVAGSGAWRLRRLSPESSIR